MGLKVTDTKGATWKPAKSGGSRSYSSFCLLHARTHIHTVCSVGLSICLPEIYVSLSVCHLETRRKQSPVDRYLCQSLTHTHTYKHTHTLSVYLSLYVCLSISVCLSVCLSLSP
jgi:hypothetical protein